MKKILVSDMGGTNSRFAFFRLGDDGALELVEVTWLKTSESTSFGHLIMNLRASGFPLRPDDCDVAVFAAAGPVEGGVRCSPPFISWDIDLSSGREDFGFPRVALINDFVAQAYACRSQAGESARQVKEGTIVPDAVAAVIGAGTALGKAALVPDGRGGYRAIPSEGGHASFPFETERECEFQKYLIGELGDTYITWNKVVSGQGLSLIHHFLTGEKFNSREVVNQLKPGSETLDWAARFYGRACRNFALEILAEGGVYVTGGVAARTPLLVTHRTFLEEFTRSDTLEALLERIPLFLISDQNAGLWGCAVLGRQMLQTEGRRQ